jgi:hypothetical protein
MLPPATAEMVEQFYVMSRSMPEMKDYVSLTSERGSSSEMTDIV